MMIFAAEITDRDPESRIMHIILLDLGAYVEAHLLIILLICLF